MPMDELKKPKGEEIEQETMSEEDAKRKIGEKIEEYKRAAAEAQEAVREGKGRLKLETPIKAGDREIEELIYDFTDMTGLDYTEAMDSDPNAMQVFKMTNRQALALFARSAARHTERVDARDIVERIGMTDALEGVQLATLFFNASTRAGHLRISKK